MNSKSIKDMVWVNIHLGVEKLILVNLEMANDTDKALTLMQMATLVLPQTLLTMQLRL